MKKFLLMMMLAVTFIVHCQYTVDGKVYCDYSLNGDEYQGAYFEDMMDNLNSALAEE